jgi:alpha-ketoglutarate-dependent taurine dioxygenase
MHLEERPITGAIGLEITGISGHDFVDRDVADHLLRSLDRYGVVACRDAFVEDSDLVALTRMLGEVVIAPHGNLANHPEIAAISLDPERDPLAEYRKGTFFWHIDGAQDLAPQKATLLVALEVAEEGGGTEFANTFAAYAALPDEDKELIAALTVRHQLAATQRLVYPDPTPKQLAAWASVPDREHPLVWTRPDGRRSLLIGATAGEIVGWPHEEGRALLDRLLDWTTQPRFVLEHQWRPGDLVAWDNTGMLHRAQPYEATSQRLLHRTTLVGHHPVA